MCGCLAFVCVCFITASWDTSLPPAHCSLCPSHCSPFSAQVWSDYLLTESAYLERKKMDPTHTATHNRVSCVRTPLSATTPPQCTFILDHFSAETCTLALRAHVGKPCWNGATWLLKIYCFHLSDSLVATSVKLSKSS